MKKKKFRLLLTGGGSGGHIYPALAIYDILKRHDLIEDVLYVGNKDKLEGSIVPQKGIPFYSLKSVPFAGVSNKRRFVSFFLMFNSFIKALVLIFRFKPDIVIATGGYVSAPLVFAAFFCKIFFNIKIVLQEQNLVPGIFNKFASIFTDVVFVSFHDSTFFLWSNKCVYTGYIFRSDYNRKVNLAEIKNKYNIPIEKNIILSYGGSLGAKSINDMIHNVYYNLLKEDLFFIHISGKNREQYKPFDEVISNFEALGFKFSQADNKVYYNDKYCGLIFDYCNELFKIQSIADIIITRAGAGAIAELAFLGKPSILIPKIGLSGEHQFYNAISLAQNNAAIVCLEKKQNGKIVVDYNEIVDNVRNILTNSELRINLKSNIKKFYYKDYEKKFLETIYFLFDDPDKIEYVSQVIMPDFVKYQLNFDSLVNYLIEIRNINPGNVFFKYYTDKMNDYLNSDNWTLQNKAIKLAGALNREDILQYFAKKYDELKGFQRRNLFIAYSKLDSLKEIDFSLIKKGLEDSYFEVKRECLNFCMKHIYLIRREDFIKEKVLYFLSKRESFEVKSVAIKILPFLVSNSEFFKIISKYKYSSNIRIRESILDSIYYAYQMGIFADLNLLKLAVKDTLITTSSFEPMFKIRDKYKRLISIFEDI